jgi:hypothetical protein
MSELPEQLVPSWRSLAKDTKFVLVATTRNKKRQVMENPRPSRQRLGTV